MWDAPLNKSRLLWFPIAWLLGGAGLGVQWWLQGMLGLLPRRWGCGSLSPSLKSEDVGERMSFPMQRGING